MTIMPRMASMDLPETDDALLARVAKADRDAFAQLMDRHMPMALGLATRMTGNVDDAQELAQEAFLKVWTKAGDWNPERGARFSTWLYRVVTNMCLDRGRQARALPLEVAGDPEDGDPAAHELVAESQARRAVGEAMAELPERQRAALTLCYFSALDGREAARILEVSQGALESLLVRGRRGLKESLVRRGLTRLGDLL
jgi:RNA polymerase sigma-70 factor (ECF subfamily)